MKPRPLLLAAAVFLAASRLHAALGVSVTPSVAGPQPVGTIVRWTAGVTGGSNDLWYRFRVGPTGGPLRVARDFGPIAALDWTELSDGVFDVELTVRDRASLETAAVVESYRLASRVGTDPIVSPTAHPLVFLFSSPPCEAGRARVRFEPGGGGLVQYTNWQACEPGRDLNFYVAGLQGGFNYQARLVVEAGRDTVEGPVVAFTAGVPVFPFARPSVVAPAPAGGVDPVLLQAPTFYPPFATDLNGALLWYGPAEFLLLTRQAGGGTFLGIAESRTDPAQDFLRRFDLVGMTLAETNAARVSEQLVAMGMRPITGFHHEAQKLRDGRTVVLCGVEQLLTNVQGPGTVDVLADMIVVLDADFQVVWAWDAFDHLDVERAALLGEHCLVNAGCPPWYLAPDANDWTHGNSVAETPDGSLLFSVRHQDWVVKIDYAGGLGTGDVVWRLGKDGDFALDSADGDWFSHQHDVELEPAAGPATLSLFDNGNTRAKTNAQAHSRGQALEIDEAARTAHLVLNADLGVFSLALGSAQRLSDGNWHFDAGFVFNPQSAGSGQAFSLEISPPQTLVSSLTVLGPIYRSFRVADLYGPPEARPTRPPTRVVGPRG